MPERIPKSVAKNVVFRAIASSDHYTPATGKTIAITIRKWAGSFANPAAGATNATEIASGFYHFALGTGDTDTAGPLAWRGAGTGIDDVGDVYEVVNATNAGFSALPDAAAGAASGVPVLGANATAISFTGGMTISSSTGSALTLSSSGSNGSGLAASGNGSGHGIAGTGGATGNGFKLLGGATSGAGLDVRSQGGTGSTNYAAYFAGNASGADAGGIYATGGTTGGDGIEAIGTGNGHGFYIVGSGTGEGLHATGGAAANGHGVHFEGVGTNSHGLLLTRGGAGGDDLAFGNNDCTVPNVTTVATATNVTTVNGLAANVITATSIAADAITDAKVAADVTIASVTGAVGSVTGNVGGNVTGSVGSVTGAVGSVTAAVTVGTISANVITASALATDAVNEIADGVWDEAISGHLTAGTTGEKLNAAGAAGDPWTTALPGAYGAGTAGKILSRIPDVAAGAAGGVFIAGANAATTVDITGNLSGSVGSVTGAVTVGTINANVITASALATDAVNEIADGVWDEATAGHVTAGSTGVALTDILTDTAEIGAAGAGLTNIHLPDQTMNITGNITGNLSGSVGSVTGAVGSVTGAVGSVTAEVTANMTKISGSAAAADNLEESTEAIVYGTVDGTGATATVFKTSALTPDAGVVDQFKGRVLIFKTDTTTAVLRGQAAGISGHTYTSAEVITLTVASLTTAPASGDTFVIL